MSLKEDVKPELFGKMLSGSPDSAGQWTMFEKARPSTKSARPAQFSPSLWPEPKMSERCLA